MLKVLVEDFGWNLGWFLDLEEAQGSWSAGQSLCVKKDGCKGENPVLFSSLSTDFNGQGEREWVLVFGLWP